MEHDGDRRSELVERARALAPLLAERAAEGERLRRIPEDVGRALQDAGMFSLMRPRRYGGHQVDIATYLQVLAELARGDGSVGWVVAQLNNTQWMCAQFGRQLRDDVFAGPSSKIASVLFGASTVRRVDGGYVLEGRWPFCSGCHLADWISLAATIIAEGAQPTSGFLTVPARELTIEDDWHVAGLAATGSNSVVAREVFVPGWRFAEMGPLAHNSVTLAEVDAPLYRAALMPFMTTTAGVIAVGMAAAALEQFKALLPGRPLTTMNYASRAEAPVTHFQVGEVATKIGAARLLFHAAGATCERAAAVDAPMPVPLRMEARAQAAYGVRLCQEAVATLLLASGARALRLDNPLQRIDRDLRGLSLHPVYTLPSAFELLGRSELGMPPNTMFP